MRPVLLSYEFGAGLGHLNRLIAVARRLPEERPLVFAIPDLGLGVPVLQRAFGERANIVQGVTWVPLPRPDLRNVPTHTFADVIRLFGFHESDRLTAAVDRATHLLGEISPAMIVSDFAPTLRMASLGLMPTVVVGNGYTVPPGGRPLPSMRSWTPEVPRQSRVHEAELISVVNKVQGSGERPKVDAFSDLFQGEDTFVCTIAEFDPYKAFRQTAPLWPFNIPAIPSGPPREQRSGPPIFCYFQAGHPALDPLLSVLSARAERSEIYVQGVTPQALANRCRPVVGIYTKPADFARVLPQSSLLVHHGGLGTAYAGLMAGIPQVVLPLNLEHLITSSGLVEFGSGVAQSVKGALSQAQVADLVRRGLTDKGLAANALRAARKLHDRQDPRSVEQVAAACLRHLS
jgi:UDP:flavonoid glycosyltransferase YjiC (YdhE family)